LSNDALAQSVGLTGFISDLPSIGGLLKSRVQDFRVDEVATRIGFDDKGRFTVASVTLVNWETNRFVSKLAGRLRISRNRIYFAGTKDKRAVTKQLFVIDSPRHKVAEVELPDVDIEILGRTHQKLGFGNHMGNRFTIVVRGCADESGKPLSEEEALERIEGIIEGMSTRLGENRFANLIGPQRFGAGRPVTAEVGRHLLNDDVEAAVMTYLGMPGKDDQEEAAAFRTHIREQGCDQAALDLIPKWLGFERDILSHLIDNPEDWLGAFRTLPNNLQLMTIHALQSVVFNRLIQKRLDSDMSLTTPLEGDVVAHLDDKGKLDLSRPVIAESRTLSRLSRNCQLNRLAVTGLLPGNEVLRAEGEVRKIEDEVIEECGLEGATWQVEKIRRLSTKGTRRALVATFSDLTFEAVPPAGEETLGERWSSGPKPEDQWHPEGACIRFRFTLPSGTYATTFLREFMHSPIDHYS